MEENRHGLERPIRVVVFTGGPTLDRAVKRFILLLEEQPEIEFLGAICQSGAQSFWAIVADLWRRRRLLAPPLLLVYLADLLSWYLFHPRRALRLRRRGASVRDRILFIPDIHADSVLARVGDYAPDLGLIYGSPILKPALFEIPRFGTLGIHHGTLPEYRGKKTTFWAMYNGEGTAGVTIQRVNEGLDTGEVVRQGQVPIDGRFGRAVWGDLEELGFDLYMQAILDIKHGVAVFQPPAGKKGKLYRDPKLGDILTFWWRLLSRLITLNLKKSL